MWSWRCRVNRSLSELRLKSRKRKSVKRRKALPNSFGLAVPLWLQRALFALELALFSLWIPIRTAFPPRCAGLQAGKYMLKEASAHTHTQCDTEEEEGHGSVHFLSWMTRVCSQKSELQIRKESFLSVLADYRLRWCQHCSVWISAPLLSLPG